MLSLTNIQAQLKKVYPNLLSRYPIKKMSLFGSYARNDEKPSSDIDILVEFSKPVGFQFFELAKELEALLNHSVDLVSKNGVKPKYLSEIEEDLIDVEA